MRYLAVDLGDRRTGLATGQDTTALATPLNVIETASEAERLRQIQAAIAAQGADALVLGLPLNMDGSEGEPAKRVVAFAERLSEATGLDVYLVDERQTSELANELMARSGLSHQQKKARRDALAAAAILERFFQSQA